MDTIKTLYSLVYISKTTETWTDSGLKDLVSNAVSFNIESEITGMLIFMNDRFIQVLEGEEKVVKSLYQSICKDPRHEKQLILVEHPIHKRNFVGWSMGYKKINTDQLERASGFTNVDQFIEKPKIKRSVHPALLFLKMFYEKNNS